MGVTITKSVDIDIYKVATEDGDEIDFYAELDRDDDIVITLKHESVLSYTKELLNDEANLSIFLENCCDDGLESAIVAIFNELQHRGLPMKDLYSLMDTTKSTDDDMDIAVGNVYKIGDTYSVISFEDPDEVTYKYKVLVYNPETKRTSFSWYTSKGDELAYRSRFNITMLRDAELVDTNVDVSGISEFIKYVDTRINEE